MNIEQIVDFAQANSAPEHYSPAPEKILKGDPKQSVRNHYGTPCGSSTPVSGKAPWASGR